MGHGYALLEFILANISEVILQRGKLISFEGPEGCGKTTHAMCLKTHLEKDGRKVIYTREPGGTLLGEKIRGILQGEQKAEELVPAAETLLFAACRAQLVHQVIKPALASGVWVIVDRYVDSTIAYQGFGRGLPLEDLKAINSFALGGMIPDITILLDVPLDESFKRLGERLHKNGGSKDRFEKEERAFHERVRQGYLNSAKQHPERIRVINGIGSVEEVDNLIWEAIGHEAK